MASDKIKHCTIKIISFNVFVRVISSSLDNKCEEIFGFKLIFAFQFMTDLHILGISNPKITKLKCCLSVCQSVSMLVRCSVSLLV